MYCNRCRTFKQASDFNNWESGKLLSGKAGYCRACKAHAVRVTSGKNIIYSSIRNMSAEEKRKIKLDGIRALYRLWCKHGVLGDFEWQSSRPHNC